MEWTKWTIISQGNVDLIHAGIGNGLEIGVPRESFEVFRGEPSLTRHENLCLFLESCPADESQREIMAIFDDTYIARHNNFMRPRFPYLRQCIMDLLKRSPDNVILLLDPFPPMRLEKEIKFFNFIFNQGYLPDIESVGAVLASNRGCQKLLSILRGETTDTLTLFNLQGFTARYKYEALK